MPLIPEIENSLRELGAQRRRLAVRAERDREAEFLAYWIDHPECYPTTYERAAWKQMRTMVRFRFKGGQRG